MEWGFEVGPSPSAAVLHPSGSIPSHSSCHLHTCSTYTVNSLICHSATIFEDKYLLEKLLAKLVHEPWEQCSMSAIIGRRTEVWKIVPYELGVLVLSSVRRWWKAVFSVDTLESVCFRHTASVCKFVVCNTIVSVVFSPTVTWNNNGFSFFLFLQWFFILIFLIPSSEIHMAQFC